jgi:pimeloyl-ACP methyl ester carboxylesterase
MEKLCRVIEIITPKKCVLHGLWFGSDKPKKAIVFIHGLSSTAFSNHGLVLPLVNKNTAVVTFGNRGRDKVTKLKKIDKRRKKGYSGKLAGEVHEEFPESVDDIQGVVDFIQKKGVDQIYLVGHSTGCQKSIFFLSKRGKQSQIKGVVLLCPVSDYAAIQKFVKRDGLEKVTKYAKKLVKQGKPHSLLPFELWPHYHDAQRFLSLYTPDSEEEIFTYAQEDKEPRTLKRVKIPTLVIYAGSDEYHDRPAAKIADWFKEYSKSEDLTIKIVKDASHSFKNLESKVIGIQKNWLAKR